MWHCAANPKLPPTMKKTRESKELPNGWADWIPDVDKEWRFNYDENFLGSNKGVHIEYQMIDLLGIVGKKIIREAFSFHDSSINIAVIRDLSEMLVMGDQVSWCISDSDPPVRVFETLHIVSVQSYQFILSYFSLRKEV